MSQSAKPRQTSELVLVSPRMATDELEIHNNMNREIRASDVDALARKMENNEWADNGETVTYDTKGEIVNGQHRYAAVVKSGKPQWLWIIRGVKPEARPTVDDNRRRSFADDLTMNGIARGRDLEAITRKIIAWNRYGGLGRSNQRRLMRDDIARVFSTYANDMNVAYDIAGEYPRIPMTRANKAFLYWLLRQHADEKLIRQFFSVLSIGSQFDKDLVVTRLRDKMLEDRAVTGTAHKGQLAPRHLWFTIRVWNAWITGEKLGKFQTPTSGIRNPFPTPVSVERGES